MTMIRNAFHAAYLGRTEAFLKHLECDGFDSPEGFHRLRLDIKAIRAAADLLDFLHRGKSGTKRLRTMLSPVFDAAGIVRTAQMDLNILATHWAGHAGGFRKALREQEVRSRNELRDLAGSFDREGFRLIAGGVGEVIAGLERARVRVYSAKFINTRYDLISGILRKAKTDEDLHDARKNIKVVRNVLRLLSGRGIRTRSGIEKRIVGTIDRILGNRHDLVIFCRDLRRHAVHSPRSPATEGEKMLVASIRVSIRKGFPTLLHDTRRRMETLRHAAGI